VRIIGISNVTDAETDAAQGSCDFAIFPFSDSDLYRLIDGVSTPLGVGYAPNDRIGVEVTAGGRVNFLKNGQILYQITGPTLNYPLCVDCSLESSGSSLSEVKVTVIA
jgi:hypothetical protein